MAVRKNTLSKHGEQQVQTRVRKSSANTSEIAHASSMGEIASQLRMPSKNGSLGSAPRLRQLRMATASISPSTRRASLPITRRVEPHELPGFRLTERDEEI